MKFEAQVKNHAKKGRKVVVIQGLGFVGTAVAAVISSARDAGGNPLYVVIGVDKPDAAGSLKVDCIQKGFSPVVSDDVELSRIIAESKREGRLFATTSEEAYSLADFIVVDVPFDVHKSQAKVEPFQTALRGVGRFMKPEALVVIETTVPVGTCSRIASPTLKEERLRRGIREPLFMSYAYERVMPGPLYIDSIRKNWRTFAALDKESAAKTRIFLSSFTDTRAFPLFEFKDFESAETAKLLENSYRAANIAFIYEWTLLAEQIGIDLFSVIESIKVRKGTHDNIRYPGFGVGGYCLTKDSLLAQWSAANFFKSDVTLEMSLEALKINGRMPHHTFDLLKELSGQDLKGKKIAVMGVSYLPNVADARNSPSAELVKKLTQAGAQVAVHDPVVKQWPEQKGIAITSDLSTCLKHASGVAFVVAHDAYRKIFEDDFMRYFSAKPFITDAQNVITDEHAAVLHAAGCRLLGVGKGHWRKLDYHE